MEQRKVEVARTREEIERLRSAWESMRRHPNSEIAQYIWALDGQSAASEPYVLLMKNDGKPEALLAGRKETRQLDVKLGYMTLWRPRVRALTFIYAGYMGIDYEGLSRDFVQFIYDRLRSGEADVAWFNSVATDSNLFRAIRTVPHYVCRDIDYLTTQHWSMRLPVTVEAFWGAMTAKHRYWLKRLPKVLERDHPGGVQYRAIYDGKDLECLCMDSEIVARKTYQRGLGVGFADSEAMRTRLGRIAAAGQLRAYLLHLKDRPVAFWIGQVFGKEFHLHYTGFDPDWRKYEVGTILFVRMIEDVIARDAGKVTRVDFGLGDASYKQRFGDANWQESSLYLYAPTLRGISIRMARAGASRLERTAKCALERWKLEERVKRYWRKRKAQYVKSEAGER